MVSPDAERRVSHASCACALFSQTDAAFARGAVFEVTYSQAIQSELIPRVCLHS